YQQVEREIDGKQDKGSSPSHASLVQGIPQVPCVGKEEEEDSVKKPEALTMPVREKPVSHDGEGEGHYQGEHPCYSLFQSHPFQDDQQQDHYPAGSRTRPEEEPSMLQGQQCQHQLDRDQQEELLSLICIHRDHGLILWRNSRRYHRG